MLYKINHPSKLEWLTINASNFDSLLAEVLFNEGMVLTGLDRLKSSQEVEHLNLGGYCIIIQSTEEVAPIYKSLGQALRNSTDKN